jgi:hypothetical protein
MSAARARQLMAAETAEPGTAPRGKSTLGERYHQRSGPVKRKPAICEIFRILREVPGGTDQPVGPSWPSTCLPPACALHADRLRGDREAQTGSGAQAGQKGLRRPTRGAGQPPGHRAGREARESWALRPGGREDRGSSFIPPCPISACSEGGRHPRRYPTR